jgi:hypothetical protein
VVNSLKMIVKMLALIHMVVCTWWCWHIYKGEVFGIEMGQLGEEMEEKVVTVSDRTLDLSLCPVTHSRGGVALASCDLTLGEEMT